MVSEDPMGPGGLTAISKERRTAEREKTQGKTNESRLVKYVEEDREGKKG